MRIELERTGGFVGQRVRWTLDTETLPPADAAEVLELASAAHEWARPPAEGADRFHYRLRIVGGERPLEVSFGEPAPAAAEPLLRRLREQPSTRQ